MAPELRRRVPASGATQGAAGAGEYDAGAAEGARGAGGGSASAGRAESEAEASKVEASSRPSSGRRISRVLAGAVPLGIKREQARRDQPRNGRAKARGHEPQKVPR